MYRRNRLFRRRYTRRYSRRVPKTRQRQFGRKVGTLACKRIEVSAPDVQLELTSKQGQVVELTYIPQDVNFSEENNNRQRNSINVRGFKLGLECLNQRNQQLYFNYAIVGFKIDVTSGTFDTGPGTNSGDVNQEIQQWFTSERGVGINRSLGATLTGLETHVLPINQNRFKVLTHKRFIIQSQQGDNELTQGIYAPNTLIHNRWIPFNREITYTGTGPDTANDKIFLVTWCGKFNEGPGLADTQACQYRRRVVTYFREPKL